MSPAANYRKAVRLTGQIASLVATWGRMAAGGGPIDPDPALGQAGNFLYLLTGQRPGALATRAFDVSLVLHADHELNASTFAARVAAATLHRHSLGDRGRDRYAQGSLHGGAKRRRHADAARHRPRRRSRPCGSLRPGQARPEGKDFRLRASRVPAPKIRGRRTCGGFSKQLGEKAGEPQWFQLSQRIEAVVTGEKKLYPNVDSTPRRRSTRSGFRLISTNADLRGEPHLRMDGARPRAVRQQQVDPAADGLHRAAVSAAVSGD
jgi:citrate synthase